MIIMSPGQSHENDVVIVVCIVHNHHIIVVVGTCDTIYDSSDCVTTSIHHTSVVMTHSISACAAREYVVMDCIVLEGGNDRVARTGICCDSCARTTNAHSIEGMSLPHSYAIIIAPNNVYGRCCFFKISFQALSSSSQCVKSMSLFLPPSSSCPPLFPPPSPPPPLPSPLPQNFTSKATIACSAFNGFPTPSVQWRKDRLTISGTEGEGVKIESCPTSTILDIIRQCYDDVGTKVCFITDSRGSNSVKIFTVSAHMTVT